MNGRNLVLWARGVLWVQVALLTLCWLVLLLFALLLVGEDPGHIVPVTTGMMLFAAAFPFALWVIGVMLALRFTPHDPKRNEPPKANGARAGIVVFETFISIMPAWWVYDATRAAIQGHASLWSLLPLALLSASLFATVVLLRAEKADPRTRAREHA